MWIRKNKEEIYLLLGTDVSSTLWNDCCWNPGKLFWLLKNVFVAVCDGGVASENRSSVNNCCDWTVVFDVVYWPFEDGCWEKKSVPPKPFPLFVVVVPEVNALGDEESLF